MKDFLKHTFFAYLILLFALLIWSGCSQEKPGRAEASSPPSVATCVITGPNFKVYRGWDEGRWHTIFVVVSDTTGEPIGITCP